MIICYTVPETWHVMDVIVNFSFWAIFCPFTHLTAQKIKISGKWKKKYLEISSSYTSVSKIMIICYTVPEIWCMTDVIVIFHFGLFFALLPLMAQKIKTSRLKKMPGDIIILHKCTKIHDHMLYCSWHMVCETWNCHFSFWAIFCPFTLLTAPKILISKNKWKNTRRYHHLTQMYQKYW